MRYYYTLHTTKIGGASLISHTSRIIYLSLCLVPSLEYILTHNAHHAATRVVFLWGQRNASNSLQQINASVKIRDDVINFVGFGRCGYLREDES